MVTYQVSLSSEAKAALRNIREWLRANESDAVADKVVDAILDEIDGLATMPTRHGRVQEINNDEVIFRRVLKWSYKIIFVVDEDEIEVLVVDITHGKQDPQRLQDKYGS